MKLLVCCLFLVMAFNYGCSSKGKDGEEREFKKDYVVVDAQYKSIPGWINEAEGWAKRNEKKDSRKFRYFVSTTGLIKNKRLCMKSAEAQAAALIAGEITQFVKNSYSQSVQGDEDEEVESYMEDTLAQEIQSFLVGARKARTYWEKRKYKEDLGAEENKTGLICSALMKMKKSTIKKAIKNAMKKLVGSVSNPESKSKAEAAGKAAAAKFDAL